MAPPDAAGSGGRGPAKPRTLRDFGSMLPKPAQAQQAQPQPATITHPQPRSSPAAGFRSPRMSEPSATGLQPRSPRMPTALPGATSQQSQSQAQVRSRRSVGGGYLATSPREHRPEQRVPRASRKSTGSMLAPGANDRDGFEIFFGTGHGATVPAVDEEAAGEVAQKQAWLQQIKALETQLQATLARGPVGVAAATGETRPAPSAALSHPRVRPPPAAVEGGETAKEVETFSLSTPSAPGIPAPVAATKVAVDRAHGAPCGTDAAERANGSGKGNGPPRLVPCLNLPTGNA